MDVGTRTHAKGHVDNGKWTTAQEQCNMDKGTHLKSYRKSISAGTLDSRLCVDFSFHQIDEYLKKLQSRMPYK